MKRITLLGSTGSIGIQALNIVAEYPKKIHVVGMPEGENIDLFAQQIYQIHLLRSPYLQLQIKITQK